LLLIDAYINTVLATLISPPHDECHSASYVAGEYTTPFFDTWCSIRAYAHTFNVGFMGHVLIVYLLYLLSSPEIGLHIFN